MEDRPFPKEMLDRLPPEIREVFEELNIQMWTPGDKMSCVMCMRIEDRPEPAAPSKQLACFRCHKRVWISNGTFEAWKQMPGTPIICTQCMDPFTEEFKEKHKGTVVQ